MTNREIDCAIAEKVMGWTKKVPAIGKPWWARSDDTFAAPAHGKKAWSPSTDIAAAWSVVEKMRMQIEPTRKGWRAGVYGGLSDKRATADTAPLAICLAALKAIGVEVGGGEK